MNGTEAGSLPYWGCRTLVTENIQASPFLNEEASYSFPNHVLPNDHCTKYIKTDMHCQCIMRRGEDFRPPLRWAGQSYSPIGDFCATAAYHPLLPNSANENWTMASSSLARYDGTG